VLLRAAGYGVAAYENWRRAREALLEERVDAIVLCDWRRLGGRGSHRYLKTAAAGAPFILVCDGGVTRWDERFTAVLYYPVDKDDLSRAIDGAIADVRASVTLGEFTLDLKARTLTREQLTANLTPIQTAILRALMLAQGGFVNSNDLLREVWGFAASGDRRVLYTHIAWLRRRLLAKFGPGQLLVSKRRRGYRFDATDSSGDASAPAGE